MGEGLEDLVSRLKVHMQMLTPMKNLKAFLLEAIARWRHERLGMMLCNHRLVMCVYVCLCVCVPVCVCLCVCVPVHIVSMCFSL